MCSFQNPVKLVGWRSTVATLLTFFICVAILAPLLMPGAEASLPACCRTHGKHHCLMNSEPPAGDVAGARLIARGGKCAYWPTAAPATPSCADCSARGPAICGNLVSRPAASPDGTVIHLDAFHRNWRQRGPPYCSLVS